jgi:hypothetical protein
LSPPTEGDPIIALIPLQYLRDHLAVLEGQPISLGFAFLLQFHPVVEGGAEEVENELCALAYCLFVEFIGEDLVEVVRMELLVLFPIPQPNLSLDAFDILFPFGGWRLLGPASFEL